MRCYVCNKVLPNRQTRIRKLVVMETTKFGTFEKAKQVHRKCRENFVIKHKILRAAGQPHLLPPEKAKQVAWTTEKTFATIPDTTHRIKPYPPPTHPNCKSTIVGNSADLLILDDVLQVEYDKETMEDMKEIWSRYFNNQYTDIMKGGCTNAAITTSDPSCV